MSSDFNQFDKYNFPVFWRYKNFLNYYLVNSQLRLLHFQLFDWLKNSDYEPIVGVLRHMENSAPSLKILLFLDAFNIVEIKIGGKTRFENLLKQLFHSPLLDMKYALVGYFVTSYPTRAHGIIVIYFLLNFNNSDVFQMFLDFQLL